MRTVKLSVLLVEDRPLYNFNTKKIMEASGLVKDATICSGGKEAFAYLAATIKSGRVLPDVIFLDINIALLNECEFLNAYEQLKESIVKNVELYLVCPAADVVDIAKSGGFSFIKGCLIKPLLHEKLLQALALSGTPQ